MFGCGGNDPGCDSDEQPPRSVTVEGFWMGLTEVPAFAYLECVQAGACVAPPDSCEAPDVPPFEVRQDFPVHCVSWEDAESFCRWIGGRLPTSMEWEYAARGGGTRAFPWGEEEPDGSRANFCDRGCIEFVEDSILWSANGWWHPEVDDGHAALAPVGSYPLGKGVWELRDMAGNVAEWTATSYDESSKEVRGGSFLSPPNHLRTSKRLAADPRNRSRVVGFRCVRDEPSGVCDKRQFRDDER